MKIDHEFQNLIPPLSKEEFDTLEKNILEEGIRDDLIVAKFPECDEEVLIDGHNRYLIAERHGGIPFNTQTIEFDNRQDAIRWIILNQFGRRNLSAYDRSVLALKLKPVIAEQANDRQRCGQGGVLLMQKSAEANGTTREELAKAAGVSHDTIHKVEVIEREAPDQAERIRAGETTINRVYNALKPKTGPKETLRRIEEEHASFNEAKKNDDIISIADVNEDKQNLQILANNFALQVMSGITKIDGALINIGISGGTLKEYINSMDSTTKGRLRSFIARNDQNINAIRNALEDKK